MTDAAINRVSHNAVGVVSSLTGSHWIATGLRPRDDKMVKEWSVDYDDYTHSLSLRGGNESDRRGNPSCLP